MIVRRKILKPCDYDRCGRRAPRINSVRIREEIRAISDFPIIVRDQFVKRAKEKQPPCNLQ